MHPPNVERTLRHFWKPAEKLVQPVRLDREPPAVVGNHKRPLKFKDSLRLEGLFPVSDPNAFVCGPSVFHPCKSVHRKLTQSERMALYDVPSELMEVFKALEDSCMPELVDTRPGDSDSEVDSRSDAEFDTTVGGDRSFDPSSAEDSFMPRKKVKQLSGGFKDNGCWEFLDDVSVGTTTAETDDATGASVVSYGEELQHDFALDSLSAGPSTVSSTTTIASEVTLVASPSSVASRSTLDSVTKDTIGKRAVKADDSKVPTFFWNSRIDGKSTDESLSGFRVMGLQG
eukprot:scaffold71690_cov22-Cyclotella_meneghiniana.AAC.2